MTCRPTLRSIGPKWILAERRESLWLWASQSVFDGLRFIIHGPALRRCAPSDHPSSADRPVQAPCNAAEQTVRSNSLKG